jgi:hypothetical protein
MTATLQLPRPAKIQMGTFHQPAAMMWIYTSLVDVVGGLLYLSTLS